VATPIPSDLGSILLATKNQLVATGVATSSSVYLGLTPDIPKTPPSDQFFVIVPSAQVVDQGVVTGGGNDTMFLDGEMYIWLWSRLNTDEPPRSDNWLTDSSLGALTALRNMIVSLQLWQPVDVNGNGLVYVPFKLLSIEQGKRLSDPRNTLPPGWGNMVTRWRFRWWFRLS
jgi:hypothetical protein